MPPLNMIIPPDACYNSLLAQARDPGSMDIFSFRGKGKECQSCDLVIKAISEAIVYLTCRHH